MKRLMGLVALAFLAAPVAAQDTTKVPTVNVAGDWDFSFTSPQGSATWRIKFEQSADTLRGTASTAEFGALEVTNGWISGNELSFTLNLNFNGTPISVNFAGTVKGDTAQGNIDVPGAGIQPFPFTAIKVMGSLSAMTQPAPIDRPRLVRLASR